jgi:hypothetical protein
MYWFEARFIKYNGDFGSRLWIGGVSARVMMRPRGPVTVDLFPLDLNAVNLISGIKYFQFNLCVVTF